jgi:hypothetical protein
MPSLEILFKNEILPNQLYCFFSFTDFGKLMPSLEIFHSKITYFSGFQTFLGDFPLTKHLFLKNSDIFEGIFLWQSAI